MGQFISILVIFGLIISYLRIEMMSIVRKGIENNYPKLARFLPNDVEMFLHFELVTVTDWVEYCTKELKK